MIAQQPGRPHPGRPHTSGACAIPPRRDCGRATRTAFSLRYLLMSIRPVAGFGTAGGAIMTGFASPGMTVTSVRTFIVLSSVPIRPESAVCAAAVSGMQGIPDSGTEVQAWLQHLQIRLCRSGRRIDSMQVACRNHAVASPRPPPPRPPPKHRILRTGYAAADAAGDPDGPDHMSDGVIVRIAGNRSQRYAHRQDLSQFWRLAAIHHVRTSISGQVSAHI